MPLDRVGCYVPGGRYPLPSSLLMTADPGAGRRRARGHRRVPAAGRRRDGRRAGGRRDAAVPGRRRAGDRRARLRHRDGSARGQDRRPRQPRTWRPPRPSCRADCAIDFYAGPTEIVVVAEQRPPAWVAADLIAQAEHDPDARAILVTTRRPLADAGGARGRARACPDRAGRRGAARSTAPSSSPHRRGERWPSPTASRPSTCCATTPRRCGADHARGHDLRRRLHRAGGRRLRHRVEPRAADRRRRALPRRPERGGLRPRDRACRRCARRRWRRLAPTVTTLARAEGLEAHARQWRSRTSNRESETSTSR